MGAWSELRAAVGIMVDHKTGHGCDEVIHPVCWKRVELAYRALASAPSPDEAVRFMEIARSQLRPETFAGIEKLVRREVG